MTETANAAQADYWNATAGPVWVRLQEALDRQIVGIGLEVMRVLAPTRGEHILDIGCGCGQTSIQLAERVGPDGAVTGIDLSAPMLAVARDRPVPPGAGRVDFRQADAQSADLGSYDAAYSRFGVMFFSDPPAAFRNIAKSLTSGGRLAFACWAPLADNPWMTAPLVAAAHLLPPLPPSDPAAPGPFAFADPQRVRRILDGAGLTDVDVVRFESRIGGGDLDTAVGVSLQIGPLGAALRENPGLADQVAGAVREALAPFATPEGVKMPSAVWIVSARKP
ncbi:MAG TPA: class I SAM-dependent methyltransferase [Caulobacteraceae bacterium]|nr:class I SAM-dependent methyltransferase [Caulobacteraceae bacterium]